MKKIIKFLPLLMIITSLSSCLKSNKYFEDFSSTQPIADIPKAPANTVTVSTAPTASWFTMDSSAAGVDYATAVHISAKEHVGSVTVRMKIDTTAGSAFVKRVPYFVQKVTFNGVSVNDTVYYAVIPATLYTVNSNEVTITNAGVFSTADYVVHIKTGTIAPDGQDIFIHRYPNKHFAYILPVSIESVPGTNYTIASNFQTILWKINVK